MIFIYEESLRSSYINIIFVKGIKEKVESYLNLYLYLKKYNGMLLPLNASIIPKAYHYSTAAPCNATGSATWLMAGAATPISSLITSTSLQGSLGASAMAKPPAL